MYVVFCNTPDGDFRTILKDDGDDTDDDDIVLLGRIVVLLT